MQVRLAGQWDPWYCDRTARASQHASSAPALDESHLEVGIGSRSSPQGGPQASTRTRATAFIRGGFCNIMVRNAQTGSRVSTVVTDGHPHVVLVHRNHKVVRIGVCLRRGPASSKGPDGIGLSYARDSIGDVPGETHLANCKPGGPASAVFSGVLQRGRGTQQQWSVAGERRALEVTTGRH